MLRFVPHFDTADEAASFALAQGIAWLGAEALPARPTATAEEQAAWPRKN